MIDSTDGSPDNVSSAPPHRKSPDSPGGYPVFVRRVLTFLSLTALFVAGGLVLIYGIHVFLLVFAGILFGVGIAGLADLTAGWTGLGRKWALGIVILGLLGILGGTVFGLGYQIAGQAEELVTRLPQSAGQIRQELAKLPVFKRMFGNGPKAQEAVDKATEQVRSQSKEGAARTARQIVSQTGAALGGTLLVFFLALFFAADPGLYRKGVLHLLPKVRRPRGEEVMDNMGQALRRWWLGTLFAMASAAAMTFVGLWLMGIPLALSLAALAGLGEFVPNFGPFVAAIPGVMLAFVESPNKAAGVAGLYIAIQTVQSYIITPLVQQRVVDLPPALQVFSQVLMAALFGPLGLLMATPLLTVVMVLVKMLYVQDALNDCIKAVPGSDQ